MIARCRPRNSKRQAIQSRTRVTADFDFALGSAIDDLVPEYPGPEFRDPIWVSAINYQFSKPRTHLGMAQPTTVCAASQSSRVIATTSEAPRTAAFRSA